MELSLQIAIFVKYLQNLVIIIGCIYDYTFYGAVACIECRVRCSTTSVHLSVTLWYCILMKTHIVKLFPPSPMGISVVFSATLLQNSMDGN